MRYLIKYYVIAFLLFFTFKSNAQSPVNNGNAFDGPYLLYVGDSIVITEAKHETAQIKSSRKSYPLKDRQKLSLDIRFSDAPEKNFSVKLKPKLVNEPAVWTQPEKMLVLSDIEGEFDALRDLLLANGVMSNKYEWTFGKGHLVICGDLFDRGKDVPATLWLLYKLEEAAKAKGGYVHTILGNHDIMNLAGNLKYVDPKYLKGAEMQGFKYTDFYSAATELGRWLRSKNLVEKIGDNLCLHGGVSPGINALGLGVTEINKISRPYIGWENLKNTVSDSTVLKIFNSTDGLFWYRGYFREPAVDEKVINQTLAIHQVKRIIVGHTITKTNIGFYYQGKVLGVDVNHHAGKHEGALYEAKQWYKVDLSGKKTALKIQ